MASNGILRVVEFRKTELTERGWSWHANVNLGLSWISIPSERVAGLTT